MNYWLVVTDPENFAISRQRNFDVEGFQDRYKNTDKNVIKLGDKLVDYIKGYYKFGAIVEAISPYYYCETKIWESHLKDKNEIYPHRFKIRPVCILNENQMLNVKNLAKDLDFIPATNWGSVFRQSLRRIPQKDFERIQSEMKILKAVKP